MNRVTLAGMQANLNLPTNPLDQSLHGECYHNCVIRQNLVILAMYKAIMCTM